MMYVWKSPDTSCGTALWCGGGTARVRYVASCPPPPSLLRSELAHKMGLGLRDGAKQRSIWRRIASPLPQNIACARRWLGVAGRGAFF
eukprot:357665-Chlamydomonas_euryale.AAC.2